ncbi:nucleotide-sugar transporter-domain-containing protein [Cristinia sonorae]|uniref:Nucleotide-sugar transporter-domain-containing protein n=1 Tax=Cristinia sonorae TaxID=1940300 RepID=A0A8K0UWW8_9AGAR|nr:nucleotide-sugar transporter-domain-containing protein [Cristinia sonorae]
MDDSKPRRVSSLRDLSAKSADVYQRTYPSYSSPPSPVLSDVPYNGDIGFRPSPRLSPLLPCSTPSISPLQSPGASEPESPTICGLPLKYVSLVTLAVQNAALSIVMHYSRVSIPAAQAYSPATAVLLNELLKGSISFVIALARVLSASDAAGRGIVGIWVAFRRVSREIFSFDCWKLSIPALLYVVQNSLQFVAISNLPVATFQVTYQMKILTTAAFSVALLRKKLTSNKWLSLFFLAMGVAIVQIQQTSGHAPERLNRPVGSAHDEEPLHIHIMSPLKGFGAVTAACFTSGLAGVYFEMVLKNSKADLWVRNVQLSLFSLIPAALPIFWESRHHELYGFNARLFQNFGGWAWATVAIQVLGGLITAVVIKYSDNILKGFATSLSIVLSFLASVVLFGFRITPSFVIGSSTVLVATWMYNQPPGKELVAITNVMPAKRSPTTSFVEAPLSPNAPILGQFPSSKKSSPFGSPRVIASALGLNGSEKSDMSSSESYFGQTLDTSRYLNAPYGSPFPSRTPSPAPTPPYPPGSQNSSSNLRPRQ